jgi:hypothetical protein
MKLGAVALDEAPERLLVAAPRRGKQLRGIGRLCGRNSHVRKIDARSAENSSLAAGTTVEGQPEASGGDEPEDGGIRRTTSVGTRGTVSR